MNYTCLIHPEAEKQLEEIAAYLEDQRPGFGLLFLKEYFDTLLYLEKFAHTQPIQRKGFRQIIVGRFEVLLVYVLAESEVMIFNVIHARRPPAKRYKARK